MPARSGNVRLSRKRVSDNQLKLKIRTDIERRALIAATARGMTLAQFFEDLIRNADRFIS